MWFNTEWLVVHCTPNWDTSGMIIITKLTYERLYWPTSLVPKYVFSTVSSLCELTHWAKIGKETRLKKLAWRRDIDTIAVSATSNEIMFGK